MPSNCSYIQPIAWIKYIFGDAQPTKRSVGLSSISKIATGRYRLTIDSRPDNGVSLLDDGIALPMISGPHIAAADFVSESLVEVQIRSCGSGALIDPPNGTRIVILVSA